MNKSFVIILIILLSCAGGRIEDRVINKLKNDDKSIIIYKTLCEKLSEEKDASYDLYLSLYNKGTPLVRLFEYNTIVKSYVNNNCTDFELKESYEDLISKEENYINDERRMDYFQEFLKHYYIIPSTN